MATTTSITTLTPALEDYLETTYRLVNEHGYARVRDIAEARQVRPGSVTPAMKRLHELGLVDHERREYVRLTSAGADAARRVYARHRMLRRFFETFLQLPAEVAEADACAAEHTLSAMALDRMVSFFEYLEVCPEAQGNLTRFRFLQCALMHEGEAPCPHDCPLTRPGGQMAGRKRIAELVPSQRARVLQIGAAAASRQALLDKGILPGTVFEVLAPPSSGGAIRIAFEGDELSLTRDEAHNVLVEVL